MNKNSVKTPNITFIGDNPREHRRRLKERVIMAKRNLPKNWREILVKKYPVYDKLGMANLINNVFFLKSTDISLTNVLEEISKEHKKQNHENR